MKTTHQFGGFLLKKYHKKDCNINNIPIFVV